MYPVGIQAMVSDHFTVMLRFKLRRIHLWGMCMLHNRFMVSAVTAHACETNFPS